MSEGIMFQAFAYKSPKRRARKIGMYAEIANRIAHHRKHEQDDDTETSSGLSRIFAVGQYAVTVARAKSANRHFTF